MSDLAWAHARLAELRELNRDVRMGTDYDPEMAALIDDTLDKLEAVLTAVPHLPTLEDNLRRLMDETGGSI